MKRCRKLAIFLAAIGVLLGIGWLCLPKPPPIDGVSYSQRVLDREGRLIRVTLSEDDKYRLYTPLDKISAELIGATLRHEDQYFWQHPGVNPVAALRSLAHVSLGHDGRGGASTITMQLARLRYHLLTRTAQGKLLQMYRALQIERHYSKQQILEAYLNLAPYGRNIEGAGAASFLYFRKSAMSLTRHEAVSLSVLPQSPTRRTPRADAANEALLQAANRLSARLARASLEGDPLNVEFRVRAERDRELVAPHFLRHVVTASAGQAEITTTLDASLQHLIERRIDNYTNANRRLGVTNAAAMLVDTRSMDILAQVGSAAKQAFPGLHAETLYLCPGNGPGDHPSANNARRHSAAIRRL
jgi:membrane carboxypeptidase/penicillin-binding protein PbpC